MKKKLMSLLIISAVCIPLITGCQRSSGDQGDAEVSVLTSVSYDTGVESDITVTIPPDDVTPDETKVVEPTASSESEPNTVTSDNVPSQSSSVPTPIKPPAVQTSDKPAESIGPVNTTKPVPQITTAAVTEAPSNIYPSVIPNLSKSEHKKGIAGISAMELYGKMKIGWNLGNSLDSTGNGLSSETAWNNPKVTKALIDAVKAAGFDTIRIPVTWMGHFDKNTYKIDDAWLKRVDEVINYALDNDMYVIINIHHDGNDTNQSWLTPKPENESEMIKKFNMIWYQIATYFKEYDEHLLFAGMNEFHKGYSNPAKKYLELTDKLNQTFVDTVRSTGGNNSNRILIVQAYNTNAEQSLKMKMPGDTAQNKLMVEIHFYDPWSFAGEGKGDWGKTGTNTDNWGQEDWVDNIFNRIKTNFVDKKIPVILGEYGAVNNKNGNDDCRRYYVEYVTKAAKEHGLLPIWWDNGNDGSSGEAFAIFDRYSYKKLHTDIHEAIMRAVSGKNYTIKLP